MNKFTDSRKYLIYYAVEMYVVLDTVCSGLNIIQGILGVVITGYNLPLILSWCCC